MARALVSRPSRQLFPFFPAWPSLREEFEDAFSRIWGDGGEGLLAGQMVPPIDLSETDTALQARMDLPGVKANEIEVQVSGNTLTVSGERKEEKEEKGKTYHRIERRSGTFSRSITLPCSVNEDEVAAEYHDGVLTITLPKSEQSKTKKVKVKS